VTDGVTRRDFAPRALDPTLVLIHESGDIGDARPARYDQLERVRR
jgi:hypothetical protein